MRTIRIERGNPNPPYGKEERNLLFDAISAITTAQYMHIRYLPYNYADKLKHIRAIVVNTFISSMESVQTSPLNSRVTELTFRYMVRTFLDPSHLLMHHRTGGNLHPLVPSYDTFQLSLG